MSQGYDWLLVVHLFAMVAWMAGMFYLPRLFVYHADAQKGSIQSETFKLMERRLLRGIMLPAMIVTWGVGLWLAIWSGQYNQPWLMLKVLLVLAMTGMHGWLVRRWRDFDADRNTLPARTFRIVNEAPTLLLLGILILVVVKPFLR